MCLKRSRKADCSQLDWESPLKSLQNVRTEADVADFGATNTEGDVN